MRQRKLSTKDREDLRQKIRSLVESGEVKRGVQSRLAHDLGVSRSYVHQVVMDERLRFVNPVRWEVRRRKRSKERGSVVNYREILESLKDHPAMQTHN